MIFVVSVSVIWDSWRNMGVSDAALLLPSETVALVSLPDLPRARRAGRKRHWRKSGLSRDASLPRKAAAIPDQEPGRRCGLIDLWNLKPGRIFAAVVSVSSKEAGMLMGFQFWGGKTAHDAAIASLREELARGGKPAELTRKSTRSGDHLVESSALPSTMRATDSGVFFRTTCLPSKTRWTARRAARPKDILPTARAIARSE